MENGQNKKIIEEICTYSEKVDVKDMLHEYMKRVIVNTPEDPVQFLIDQITESPYIGSKAS